MIRKNKLLIASLALAMCCAGGVGVAELAKDGELATITASAAELGEIKIGTHTGNYAWLGSTNRILFKLPDSVPVGEYKIQEGSISLTRGGNTWTRGAENGFIIKNLDEWAPDAFIDVWHFNSDVPGGAYSHEAGDVFVVNGTFSNGRDSFTINNAKVIVNSSATGDMYVEMETVDAGYGLYAAEWSNSLLGNYYPQMKIKSNSAISAGEYKQVNADAVTLTRNGTVYNLPIGNYITVSSDNNGTQQIDFALWPLGISLGGGYVAQEGDVLTVAGKFTNGAVIFEVQKTEITNLVGKPKTHSVVPVYTATIIGETGEEISNFEIRHGSVIAQPETPLKTVSAGYKANFLGWYSGETAWDFDAKATGNITLQAKFEVKAIEYTVSFVADGQTVGTATYTVENRKITLPEVPPKAGYTGVWETYELTTGDITVNAVYTEIPVEPDDPTTSEPDDPISSEEPDDPTTSEPDEPTSSEEPDDSTTSEPDESTSSEEPDDPTTSEPDEPTSSEEPDEPTSSEEPDDPISSEEPDDPTTSEPDDPISSEEPDDPTTSEPDDSVDSSTSKPETSEPAASEPITSDSEEEDEEKRGCSCIIGGVSAALAVVAAAAIVMKKKED